MLFSIIMPMYNSGNRLTNCIKSIINQTFKDFELIVINDGSTDNSLETVNSYAKQDSRIRVFSFANSGVGVARRRGIHLAKGKYLLFVDSDDEVAPLLLEVLRGIIDRHPSIDIIRYQSKLLNDSIFKDPERYNYQSNSEQISSGIDALKSWSLPHKKYAVYWLYAFKRTLVADDKWQYPNIRCYEDVSMIPLLVASAKTVYVSSYTGYYQFQNNSTSITNSLKELDKLKDFFAAYDFITDNLRKLDLEEEDLNFLILDFKRRLINKMDSLSEGIRAEVFTEVAARLSQQ